MNKETLKKNLLKYFLKFAINYTFLVFLFELNTECSLRWITITRSLQMIIFSKKKWFTILAILIRKLDSQTTVDIFSFKVMVKLVAITIHQLAIKNNLWLIDCLKY